MFVLKNPIPRTNPLDAGDVLPRSFMGSHSMLCSFLTAELKMQAGDWPSPVISLQPQAIKCSYWSSQSPRRTLTSLFFSSSQMASRITWTEMTEGWQGEQQGVRMPICLKMDKIHFWASHFPKQSKCWDCPLWKGNALTQRKKFRKKHFSPWIFKYSFLQNKERERRRAWVPA